MNVAKLADNTDDTAAASSQKHSKAPATNGGM